MMLRLDAADTALLCALWKPDVASELMEEAIETRLLTTPDRVSSRRMEGLDRETTYVDEQQSPCCLRVSLEQG